MSPGLTNEQLKKALSEGFKRILFGPNAYSSVYALPGLWLRPFLSMVFEMVGLGRALLSLTTVMVSDAYQHPNPSVHCEASGERPRDAIYPTFWGSIAGQHDWKRPLPTRIEPFTKKLVDMLKS